MHPAAPTSQSPTEKEWTDRFRASFREMLLESGGVSICLASKRSCPRPPFQPLRALGARHGHAVVARDAEGVHVRARGAEAHPTLRLGPPRGASLGCCQGTLYSCTGILCKFLLSASKNNDVVPAFCGQIIQVGIKKRPRFLEMMCLLANAPRLGPC